jgi:hypothetical protein
LTLSLFNSSKQEDDSVTGYAQDPGYDDIDRSILNEHGIKAVEDPEGFLVVDDSSIVLAFAPEVPVMQIVTDLAKPAAMIWPRVEACDEKQSLQ